MNDGGENGNECQAKIMSDELLPKLCKISKQIATKGGSNKMAKKASKKADDVNQKIEEELLSKGDRSQLFGKDGLFNKLLELSLKNEIQEKTQ